MFERCSCNIVVKRRTHRSMETKFLQFADSKVPGCSLVLSIIYELIKNLQGQFKGKMPATILELQRRSQQVCLYLPFQISD